MVQPAIWLFLFGDLFHKVVDIPGFAYSGSFLAYLVPGTIAMNAMSNNMWAGMTMIEEIERGTLNRLLVTPASRLAIMNAAVVEQAVEHGRADADHRGPRPGRGSTLSRRHPGGVVVTTAAAVLVGVMWGALSNITGMLLRSREAVIAVYTFFMLPLMFLSSAFMQPGFMPGWMQAIASRNPLNWEVQIGRSALSAAPDWAGIAVRGGGLLALAVDLRGDLGGDVPLVRQERLTASRPAPAQQPTAAERGAPRYWWRGAAGWRGHQGNHQPQPAAAGGPLDHAGRAGSAPARPRGRWSSTSATAPRR